MSVTFDPNTGQYTNPDTGFSSSDGADPGLSNPNASPGNPGVAPTQTMTPMQPAPAQQPASPSSGFMSSPSSDTSNSSAGGTLGPAPTNVPQANSMIAGGTGLNLNSAPNLTSAGVGASQSTTQPYAPLVTNVPASSGPVPGGTIVQQLQTQLNEGATNPSTLMGKQGLNFQYQPVDPNAPGNALGYNPIDAGVNAPLNSAGAISIPGARNPGTSTYNPYLTGAATDADISGGARVQEQLRDILGNNTAGGDNVPLWAQPAVTESRQAMTSMGLGNSTMAASAMESAILRTALPMAQQNAAERAQLDQQNLANRQQALLSNQAQINAAKQFNAQSVNQNIQFFNSLNTNIATQNAQRQTAISQFNSGQANAMTQFITNLQSQRQEFNTQNQLLVDQSNVQWRRAVNVANTAGTNAANQANVQNAFNLSQADQNILWQQAADEASWALTSGENAQNRMLSLVNSALNRQTSLQILESQLKANMFSQLGSLATNLFNSAGGLSGIASGIGSLFKGNGNNETFIGGDQFGTGGSGAGEASTAAFDSFFSGA